METLYQDLMTLNESNDSFFYKDTIKDGINYRIFNYRLASYTEFQIPGAIESRGIMFQISDEGHFIDIKSRPMEKFWNLHEVQGHRDIDLEKVIRIMDKADGSLISTYLHSGYILLKSKGSLDSDQANDANQYLYEDTQSDLLSLLDYLVVHNYTVNMEWCSPDNRIVLSYDKPHLKILNIRHNHSGEYLRLDDGNLLPYIDILNKYLVAEVDINDPKEFILQVPDMSEKIEGFVCELDDGTLFKVKTLAYIALHHSKDSVNIPRRLYEAVLHEATDDLKGLFFDDPQAISMIEEMEIFVENLMNNVVQSVETFYNNNNELSRKDYAILCSKTLLKVYRGLAMNLYLDKEFSYKEFMIKNWKQFGLAENVKSEE